MGKESPWRCGDLNHVRDPDPPDIGQQKHMHESMLFPTTYMKVNPFCCALPDGNASSFFPDFVSHKFLDLNRPPFFPLSVNPSGYTAAATVTVTAAAQKRFLVFDQSGDQTNLVYSSVGSPFLAGNAIVNVDPDPWSDGANNVSAGGEEEEMHEDTEEIDALLYSDSEDGALQEEEASSGHSPIETVTVGSAGDVGSNLAMPTKRKRRDAEVDDALVADTASSAGAPNQWEDKEEEGEWSCVGGGGEEEHRSKRMKRERIQETVGVLRRIIPGGRGKDAAAVLDEAIKYLRSITSGGL